MSEQIIVLAIDDDRESLKLIFETLHSTGYEVRQADGAEFGLAAAQAIHPDLILMDCRMPGMDGFEACKRLKADEATSDIPVIFLTAATERKDMAAGFAAGGIDYVCKPFLREELLARVQAHVQTHRLIESLAEKTRQLDFERERLSVTLQGIGDGLLVTDTASRITMMNGIAERLTGWSITEAAGRPLDEVLHIINERTRASAENPVARALASGEKVGLANHTLLISRTGEERLIADSAAPIRDSAGAVVGVVMVFRDVTEEYAHQRALEESEKKYRIVADNTFDFEFWLAPAGRFLYCSPSCRRVTGRAPEEFLADPDLLAAIVHPEDRDVFAGHVGDADQAQRSGEVDFRIVHADGQVRWIAHACLPVHAADGEFLGTRGSYRDITKHKNLEEQLLQSEKMRAVGQLAGGIAHEFNNQLTVVNGFAEMVLRRFKNDPKAAPKLERILKAGRRMATLTRHLLTYSQREAVQTEVVSLQHMVKETAEMLGTILREDIRVETDIEAGLGTARVDIQQFREILLNLATNAQDAMPKGGTLTIGICRVTCQQVADAHMLDPAPGLWIRLSMTDTGEGMDEETRNRVFEPFFSTREVGQGTGLGLSMVYGAVRDNGGMITIQSTPGVGTTVIIDLPEFTKDSAEEAPAEPTSETHKRNETVLVVEDEQDVMDYVAMILEQAGYAVLQTTSSEAALELARDYEKNLALVLTDVIMPEMNGPTMVERLRVLRPALPTLYMSGYSREIVEKRGGLKPGDYILLKPMSREELLGAVETAINPGEKGE